MAYRVTWDGLGGLSGFGRFGGGEGGDAGPVMPTFWNHYDFRSGLTDDGGGLISAVANQGVNTCPLINAGGASRPTKVGREIQHDAGEYLTQPLIDASVLVSRMNIPNLRNGPADTTTSSDFPAWNSATSYVQDASTSYIRNSGATLDSGGYAGDGFLYMRQSGGNSTANVRPNNPAEASGWQLLNEAGGSLTGLNRNLHKGSDYIAGNDGRKYEGATVGASNRPSIVFLILNIGAGTAVKDTSYGDGAGDRAGELILPSGFDGLSIQSLCFDPNDLTNNTILAAFVGSGVWKITNTGTNFSTASYAQVYVGAANGLVAIGPTEPVRLESGTAFVINGTTGAAAQTWTRLDINWNVIGSFNTGSDKDNMTWDIPTQTMLWANLSSGGASTIYGTGCARLPREANGAPQVWSDTTFGGSGYGADAASRGECLCLSWDRQYLLLAVNGTYHITAQPNQSCIIAYAWEGRALANDTPVLTSFMRGYVASLVNTKSLFQYRDPLVSGFGTWSDTTAGTPFRNYLTNTTYLSGPNTILTLRSYCRRWNFATGEFTVHDDTNTLIASHTFTPSATGRRSKGMLTLAGSLQSSSTRWSSLRWEDYRDVVDVPVSDAEAALVFAAMAA